MSEAAAEIWDCVPLRRRRFVDGGGAAELGMLRLLRWGTAELGMLGFLSWGMAERCGAAGLISDAAGMGTAGN